MAEFKPEEDNRSRPLIEACIASAGMALFALFVHSGLPLVLLAGAGLLVTAVVLVHSLRAERWSPNVFGFAPLTKGAVAYLLLGCAVGAVFAVSFRVYSDMGALPAEMGRFIIAAASIGAAEEVLFRGYIQGRLQGLSRIFAVVFAATAHMIYKKALFALPPESIVISYKSFAIWTFIGGAVAGSLRELSGSVLPPLGGHVMFDLIVYGENIRAPWWVWS